MRSPTRPGVVRWEGIVLWSGIGCGVGGVGTTVSLGDSLCGLGFVLKGAEYCFQVLIIVRARFSFLKKLYWERRVTVEGHLPSYGSSMVLFRELGVSGGGRKLGCSLYICPHLRSFPWTSPVSYPHHARIHPPYKPWLSGRSLLNGCLRITWLQRGSVCVAAIVIVRYLYFRGPWGMLVL